MFVIPSKEEIGNMLIRKTISKWLFYRITIPDKLSIKMEEISYEVAEYNNDLLFEIAWAIKVHFFIICFHE